MRSAESNVTSVTSLTLDGLVPLSDHSLLFFFLFFAVYVFVLFSDSLVVYLICSQRSLRRPMFAFVAAVLLNSLAASTAVYPKVLSELLSRRGFVQVSRSVCLCQAFVLYSLGGSSFMLLSAMALDRYLSICRPLRYAALVSPAAVAALLLLCWLLPAALVGGAVLLASRLPLCRWRLNRIYCDVYSFVSLSCGGGGGAVLLSEVYGLLCSAATVFLPAAFVLFSYGRILSICLRRSRAFSSKALHTCLPHLLVFLNYSLSTAFELLHRRLQAESEPAASIVTSVLVVVVPTVLNPVVYGLKMKEIFRHVKRLLSCRRIDES
ncbi:olfactory receptor 6N1-like [Enoplosus armatus]|uniref:olfactory receptor 6N1-like n=1 Tax=Enoplosus armatus TaxID=215367 RepID=UPI0039960C05